MISVRKINLSYICHVYMLTSTHKIPLDWFLRNFVTFLYVDYNSKQFFIFFNGNFLVVMAKNAIFQPRNWPDDSKIYRKYNCKQAQWNIVSDKLQTRADLFWSGICGRGKHEGWHVTTSTKPLWTVMEVSHYYLTRFTHPNNTMSMRIEGVNNNHSVDGKLNAIWLNYSWNKNK